MRVSVASPSLILSPIGATIRTGPADSGRQSVTILDFATDTRAGTAPRPRPAAARGVTAMQLHDELWRVTRPDGEVAGYVERFTEPRGIRYRAKRLIVRQQRFISVGEFWSMDDALECFRLG
jgi:hypothetical protein